MTKVPEKGLLKTTLRKKRLTKREALTKKPNPG
jgi:hypothetical protein